MFVIYIKKFQGGLVSSGKPKLLGLLQTFLRNDTLAFKNVTFVRHLGTQFQISSKSNNSNVERAPKLAIGQNKLKPQKALKNLIN